MKVLLTGSSKGIGFNIAKTLINEGHDIALHYNKNKSALDALLKDSKTNSFAIQSDLSDSSQVKELVNNTIDISADSAIPVLLIMQELQNRLIYQ